MVEAIARPVTIPQIEISMDGRVLLQVLGDGPLLATRL